MPETSTEEFPDAVLIGRLARIGGGSPREGFGILCTYMQICSVCCEGWDAAGDCACTRIGQVRNA